MPCSCGELVAIAGIMSVIWYGFLIGMRIEESKKCAKRGGYPYFSI